MTRSDSQPTSTTRGSSYADLANHGLKLRESRKGRVGKSSNSRRMPRKADEMLQLKIRDALLPARVGSFSTCDRASMTLIQYAAKAFG